tara:strand:- start:990 stop:1205 length:216 start_codon:yes stop_codon:yes gene_type:complete
MGCGDYVKCLISDKYKQLHSRIMKKIKTVAHDIKEWDKRLARRLQDKFNLTDYQMLCLAFAKGFIIGAIIL